VPNKASNDARLLPENVAVNEYRKTLGFTWSETEEFMARHNCERHYDISELEKDRRLSSKP
jgi:hypothetical protein